MKQLTAVLLLSPLLGSADPGPATKYLIDEPASLVDIGPLRMRLDLTSGKSNRSAKRERRNPASATVPLSGRPIGPLGIARQSRKVILHPIDRKQTFGIRSRGTGFGR